MNEILSRPKNIDLSPSITPTLLNRKYPTWVQTEEYRAPFYPITIIKGGAVEARTMKNGRLTRRN